MVKSTIKDTTTCFIQFWTSQSFPLPMRSPISGPRNESGIEYIELSLFLRLTRGYDRNNDSKQAKQRCVNDQIVHNFDIVVR